MLGGAFLSLLGIADRSMDAASGPQIVLYRALGQTLFFAFVFLFLRKTPISTEFKKLTWRGWMAVCFMSAASFFMVMAMQYTLVANAIFIVSLTPLIAALLAWMFLKEKINARTTLALVIALIGVTIIFGTNMSGEGVLGMGIAMLMAIFYAGSIVTMRTIPQANIILMLALSGLLVMILMLPIVGTFTLTTHDLIICLGLGIVQVGLGTLLVLTGAKHVPAAQVSLLALLEVVLSPIWVWVFVNEVPSVTTLIGGGIVLAGVIYQALGARGKPRVS